MKVLLLQSVKKLGQKGDIIEVADGYAVNSLFPQKKAVQATAKILNDHTTKQQAAVQKQAQQKAQDIAVLEKLDGLSVIIHERVSAKGSLYHAIGAKEIIKTTANQHKITGFRNDLFVEAPHIKEVGEHQLVLSAHGKQSTLILKIEGK